MNSLTPRQWIYHPRLTVRGLLGLCQHVASVGHRRTSRRLGDGFNERRMMALAGDSMTPHQNPSFRMGYTRVYSSPDGGSHFQDESVTLTPGVYVPGIPLVDSAEPVATTALRFSRVGAGYDSDWHPAPRRQFVLVLSGVLQVTVGDGEARSFGPGSVVFVEDVAGQGHQTRALGTADAVWAAVAV